MFQLSDKMLQFEFHGIQWKAYSPVDFERYETMRPMPSFPCQTWCRWSSELQQSSVNNVSNHQLKVSCGVPHSSAFMTDQILSSLDPCGTESDRELERVPISLMSSLMVARVGAGIWAWKHKQDSTECQWRVKIRNKDWVSGQDKWLKNRPWRVILYMHIGKNEESDSKLASCYIPYKELQGTPQEAKYWTPLRSSD